MPFAEGMDDSPIALPALPRKAARPPFPWLAAAVPMVGGVALWAVTSSPFSLLFALLGPVIAVASMLDSARGSRRDLRTARARYDDETGRAEQMIVARHDAERARLDARHPDALRLAASPDDVWRAAPTRGDSVVVARGPRPSECRVAMLANDGGDLDESSAAQRLRAAATILLDAPITRPLAGGVAIFGPDPLAIAAARALLLQLCLTHAPDTLRLETLPEQGWEWARGLPHAAFGADAVAPGRHREGGGQALRVVVIDAARPPVPDADGELGDGDGRVRARIVYGASGTPADPRVQTLIAVHGADGGAQLSTASGLDEVRVQLLGEAQARALTAVLGERATMVFPPAQNALAPASLAALLGAHEQSQDVGGAHTIGAGLPAPIASRGETPMLLDIVGDGPHALVVGMTGSGKSELLVSWITALAALYPPERVVFLLADFKGGTAFAPLASLPHVVGVISDLEATGASRALQSLRAEIRWREAQLASAGARDIADGFADMPRLVVVIDEFAALIAQHPELHELFADIAARGRALGIHLILGTQRAAGSVRDGLLANLSLRVCLRVVDEADSRAVIGAAGAASLSAAQPGTAIVRRPIDDAPQTVRVALATAADREAAAMRWAAHAAPRRPWLPPLPRRLDAQMLALALARDGVRPDTPTAGDGLALGLLDEPAAQRQRPWLFSPTAERSLLVIGGPGSGKSTALHAVGDAVRRARAAGRAVECVCVPADAEGAWDALEQLSTWHPPEGAVVLIDNLDAAIAGLSADYAAVFTARVETLLRESGRTGIAVVASAQRMPIAGSRIGELFNTRLVLGLAHRADHLATGADGSSFVAERPAGRGVVGGLEVQVVLPLGVEEGAAPRDEDLGTELRPAPAWHPHGGLVGIVARTPAVLEARLRDAWATSSTVVVGLRTLQPGTRAAELTALGGGAAGGAPAPAGGGAVVVVGDADAWQQHWSLLAAIRAGHPLIIDGGSLGEFRALTGSRELPPYLSGDASWLCAPDGSVSRVQLPKARGIYPGADGLGRPPARSFGQTGRP